MTSWRQARELAFEVPAPLPAESVPLCMAAGRVLARPVLAQAAIPGFDNSAMDGFAVRGPDPWRVVARVLAGQADPGSLQPGTAVEIATGAPVPCCTDRVVPYERSRRSGDEIVATETLPRTHIRLAGEDACPGKMLLSAGLSLSPAAIGLAASAGLDMVEVHREPLVRIIVTGDELVDDGIPGPGQVRDAIGPMLPSLLDAFGAGRPVLHRLPDRSSVLADAIHEATEDVVIVCGATSVGPADGLHAALEELDATVHVDGVDCRPGHPQVLAAAAGRLVVGLPGNPFAALVAAYTIGQPLLARLSGRPFPTPTSVPVTGSVATPVPRTRLVPVRRVDVHAEAIGGEGPGFLGAAALADALAVIEPGWRAGDAAPLLPLRSCW